MKLIHNSYCKTFILIKLFYNWGINHNIFFNFQNYLYWSKVKLPLKWNDHEHCTFNKLYSYMNYHTSSPITSWQIKGEKVEAVTGFIFLGSKSLQMVTAAMKYKNLESILKSREITLPTKVHLVKIVVFPVVTYGCESWIVKKAGCQRIETFFFLFIYFY